MDQLMLMEANEVIHNSIKYILGFQPTALNGSACSSLHRREPNTKYARQSKTSGATTTTTRASEEAAWATHPRATPGPKRTGWPTGVSLTIRRAPPCSTSARTAGSRPPPRARSRAPPTAETSWSRPPQVIQGVEG